MPFRATSQRPRRLRVFRRQKREPRFVSLLKAGEFRLLSIRHVTDGTGIEQRRYDGDAQGTCAPGDNDVAVAVIRHAAFLCCGSRCQVERDKRIIGKAGQAPLAAGGAAG